MQRRSIKKLVLLVCLLGYASFMYWILSAANTRASNGLLMLSTGIPCGDKVGHFFVMGLLALMVNLLLSMRRQSIGKHNFLLGSMIVAAIVTTEEFSQIFIPSRTFCPFDLIADYAGIFIFGRLAIWLNHRRRRCLSLLIQYRVIKAWRDTKRFRLTIIGRQI